MAQVIHIIKQPCKLCLLLNLALYSQYIIVRHLLRHLFECRQTFLYIAYFLKVFVHCQFQMPDQSETGELILTLLYYLSKDGNTCLKNRFQVLQLSSLTKYELSVTIMLPILKSMLPII